MAPDTPSVAVLLWHLMETKLLLPLKTEGCVLQLFLLYEQAGKSLLFQAARNDFCDES